MKKLSLLLLSFVGLLLSGCATLDLETGAKMTNSIILDHSKIGKTIYVQVTNTANGGGEKMHLQNTINEELKKRGYEIVNSSSDASLGLFINVLFANNLKEAKAIQTATFAGTTSGVIAMGAGSNTNDSLLIGATAALAGAVGSKLLEDETFKAVIDVHINDYREDSSRETRLFVKAVQMNLNIDEAMPILEKETTKSIVNIF